MDLEVRHLQLVAAVADVGSLTRAGDRLQLTQSALSHQLRDIEERLGAALFLRIGRRLAPTPAGERLLESARDILDRLRQAEDAIRHLGQQRAGVLRITTECTTCYHWLPPLLTTYRGRFPAVEVRIDVEATSRPVQRLLDGAIDLALMSTPIRDRRLASRPVFTGIVSDTGTSSTDRITNDQSLVLNGTAEVSSGNSGVPNVSMPYEYYIRSVSLTPNPGGTQSMQIADFAFTSRTGDDRARIQTALNLRDGEKVVVGTATIRNRALIVVLTAKLLK